MPLNHSRRASRIRALRLDDPWPRWRFQSEKICSLNKSYSLGGIPCAFYLVANSARRNRRRSTRTEESRFGARRRSHRLRDKRRDAAVRLFLSGRDFHSTHQENGAFRFGGEEKGETVTGALTMDSRRSSPDPTAATSLSRIGIAISFIVRNRRVVWMRSRIWLRRAFLNSTFSKGRRC